MKKIIFTLCVIISMVMSWSMVSKASDDVVDLGVTAGETTEQIKETNSTESWYTDGDLKSWADSDTILPDPNTSISTENFFARLYNKLSSALNGFQMVAAVILIFFFVIDCIFIVVSCFGQKNKVPWFIFVAFIIAIMFVCVIYASPIVNSFKNWFVS